MTRALFCLVLSLQLFALAARAQLPPPTSVRNFVDITITGITPATAVKSQQVGINYSVSTSLLPVRGTVRAEFEGQVVESAPLTLDRQAAATGVLYLVPNQADSGTLTVSFLPLPPAGCEAPQVMHGRECLESALSMASQKLTVAAPTVHVRIAGMTWADIALKDSRDGTGSAPNGYQCISHDPGCGWWGNDGTDKFFGSKPLPAGASIEGVMFDQYWPKDVDSASGSGAWTWFDSSGTYFAHLTNGGGLSKVKWNNTCTAGFAGKPLNYSISFLVAMPEGTDLGEPTFDPGASPNSTCAWTGYVADPVVVSNLPPASSSGWSGQILYCNATPAYETLYLHIRATRLSSLAGAQGQLGPMVEDNIPVSIPPGGSGGSQAPFSTQRIYQQGTWSITSVYLTDTPTSPPNVTVKNLQKPQNTLPMQSPLPAGLSQPLFDFRGGNCL
jgi:hypothetical protein